MSCAAACTNIRTQGGYPLLAQLKTWYLEGTSSPTAFSLLTVHATALINA